MPTERRYSSTLLLLVSMATLGLTGCLKTSGGGMMQLDSGGTATLGFQAACKDVPTTTLATGIVGRVTGNFQFRDQYLKISFHTKVDYIPLESLTCSEIGQLLASDPTQSYLKRYFAMNGTYTPQPAKLGAGGNITILVGADKDRNLTQCQNGNFVTLQVLDGVYAGYGASGCVDRGNITVFSE